MASVSSSNAPGSSLGRDAVALEEGAAADGKRLADRHGGAPEVLLVAARGRVLVHRSRAAQTQDDQPLIPGMRWRLVAVQASGACMTTQMGRSTTQNDPPRVSCLTHATGRAAASYAGTQPWDMGCSATQHDPPGWSPR
jgi:hypothetical protein